MTVALIHQHDENSLLDIFLSYLWQWDKKGQECWEIVSFVIERHIDPRVAMRSIVGEREHEPRILFVLERLASWDADVTNTIEDLRRHEINVADAKEEILYFMSQKQ